MFIPDPGSSSKNLSSLTPKKAKTWFLSSKKYDPGYSSRIPDPDADFLPSRIPDPGVKKQPNPGSRIRIRNTATNCGERHCIIPANQQEERGGPQRFSLDVSATRLWKLPSTYHVRTYLPALRALRRVRRLRRFLAARRKQLLAVLSAGIKGDLIIL
jgi:hypothetical protein